LRSLIFAIALDTALRRGEILHLKRGDVDLEGRKIKVFRSKTNELRTLPVNDMVYRGLKKYSRTGDGEFMFCNRDGIPYNTAVSQGHQ
jgi:integrase